jgi:hypothetical protein
MRVVEIRTTQAYVGIFVCLTSHMFVSRFSLYCCLLFYLACIIFCVSILYDYSISYVIDIFVWSVLMSTLISSYLLPLSLLIHPRHLLGLTLIQLIDLNCQLPPLSTSWDLARPCAVAQEHDFSRGDEIT